MFYRTQDGIWYEISMKIFNNEIYGTKGEREKKVAAQGLKKDESEVMTYLKNNINKLNFLFGEYSSNSLHFLFINGQELRNELYKIK